MRLAACATALPLLLLALSAAGCSPAEGTPPIAAADTLPSVHARSDVEAGRYLVVVGGCNDCHTANYLQTEGAVPESDWLTGSPIGWRGPWGTTYASNLRLVVEEVAEDAFVQMLRMRKAMPPMPWMNVNQMSEPDMRAVYRYLRSLGPAGARMPAPVGPDEEPATPYIELVPKHLERLQPPAGAPAREEP